MPDCVCFETTWENILKKLNLSSTDINIFKRMNKLKKNRFYQALTGTKSLMITHAMKKEKFPKDKIIIYENTPGDKFFMIIKGKVRITIQGKLVRMLEDGDFFGENALLKAFKRSATATAVAETECYTISKDEFLHIIDKNLLELFKKIAYHQDTSVELKDLYYLSFLGKGKFGSVCLVHNKKCLYAIKSVSRKSVETQHGLNNYVLSEKEILLSLRHPFIVTLVKTLKNDNYFFYLMEFINGVIFDDYLTQRNQKKNINETRFYIAQLLVIIDYINRRNIIHRDIKPNNLILESNGYLKLIDFGTAKQITDFTYTIIGTPHYMAPEVLLGKGYSYNADYWSIGVCMYEMYYGMYPFGHGKHDIMEVYKEVLHKYIH
jgi:cGMP-dependent protein kinase